MKTLIRAFTLGLVLLNLNAHVSRADCGTARTAGLGMMIGGAAGTMMFGAGTAGVAGSGNDAVTAGMATLTGLLIAVLGTGIGLNIYGTDGCAEDGAADTRDLYLRLSPEDRAVLATSAREFNNRVWHIQHAQNAAARRAAAQAFIEWTNETFVDRLSDEALELIEAIGERELLTASVHIPRTDGLDLSDGPNPVFVNGTGLGVRF